MLRASLRGGGSTVIPGLCMGMGLEICMGIGLPILYVFPPFPTLSSTVFSPPNPGVVGVFGLLRPTAYAVAANLRVAAISFFFLGVVGVVGEAVDEAGVVGIGGVGIGIAFAAGEYGVAGFGLLVDSGVRVVGCACFAENGVFGELIEFEPEVPGLSASGSFIGSSWEAGLEASELLGVASLTEGVIDLELGGLSRVDGICGNGLARPGGGTDLLEPLEACLAGDLAGIGSFIRLGGIAPLDRSLPVEGFRKCERSSELVDLSDAFDVVFVVEFSVRVLEAAPGLRRGGGGSLLMLSCEIAPFNRRLEDPLLLLDTRSLVDAGERMTPASDDASKACLVRTCGLGCCKWFAAVAAFAREFTTASIGVPSNPTSFGISPPVYLW
jgi:hypothetical protein